MEPTRSVHDYRIQVPRDCGVDCIERHRGRISARCSSYARKIQPVGPDLELGNSSRPIRVRRSEQHSPTLLLQSPAEFGRRCGLSGAIDSDQQNDSWAQLRSGDRPRFFARSQKLNQPLLQRAFEISLGLELSTADFVFQRLGQLNRGCHPEVGLDKYPLQIFYVLSIEPPHEGSDIRQSDPFDAGPNTRLLYITKS